MTSCLPSTVTPALTPERLQAVARVIVRVGDEAIQEQREEVGDDTWSLGCRVYRRTCHALAALANQHSWLDIWESGLKCRVYIGGELIRFYCGEARKVPFRAVRKSTREPDEQRLFSFVESRAGNEGECWHWVIAVEKNSNGKVTRIVVQQANSSRQVRNQWALPASIYRDVHQSVAPLVQEAVEVPAVEVKKKLPRKPGEVELSNKRRKPS